MGKEIVVWKVIWNIYINWKFSKGTHRLWKNRLNDLGGPQPVHMINIPSMHDDRSSHNLDIHNLLLKDNIHACMERNGCTIHHWPTCSHTSLRLCERCAAIEEAVTSLRQSAHTEGGEEDLVIIFVRKVETHISKWGMVKTHRSGWQEWKQETFGEGNGARFGVWEWDYHIYGEWISAWFKREDWRKKEKGESSMLKNTLSIRDSTSHIVNGSGLQKSGTHTIEIRIHHAPPK